MIIGMKKKKKIISVVGVLFFAFSVFIIPKSVEAFGAPGIGFNWNGNSLMNPLGVTDPSCYFLGIYMGCGGSGSTTSITYSPSNLGLDIKLYDANVFSTVEKNSFTLGEKIRVTASVNYPSNWSSFSAVFKAKPDLNSTATPAVYWSSNLNNSNYSFYLPSMLASFTTLSPRYCGWSSGSPSPYCGSLDSNLYILPSAFGSNAYAFMTAPTTPGNYEAYFEIKINGGDTYTKKVVYQVTCPTGGCPVQVVKYPLIVKSLGNGRVDSVPSGITDCKSTTETCSANFDANTIVTLTAVPFPGSVFIGWSGACTNVSGVCSVTMDLAESVQANFCTPISCVAGNICQGSTCNPGCGLAPVNGTKTTGECATTATTNRSNINWREVTPQ